MQSIMAAVRDALDLGRHLDAWEAAQSLGPLSDWRGPEPEALAGRLAYAMGAPRLGARLHLLAGRRHRGHPLARYYHARALLGTAGPWTAWRYLQSVAAPDEDGDASLAGDWWALRASVAGRLRDFLTAEECLARAARLAPERPWLLVEQSVLLEEQDRHEEALAVVLQTLRERLYRPGVARAAYLLPRLGRHAEALELLEDAERHMQAAEVAAHVASLQLELQRPREALRALDRHSALARLLEPAGRSWEAGRRSDAHHLLGEPAEAVRWARAAKGPFFDEIAARLERGPGGPRVLLPVPAVPQHHLTCAPASLAALTAYWGRPVDHLELARRITYAGTPGWREREWARSAGWLPREFVVTWDAARALLCRKLPFTLVTTALASAHEQTVCGYDEGRGTLLARDPSSALVEELLADRLLEEQASTGPRGLVLVPATEQAWLEGLELPAAGLYDRLFELELALSRHDRDAAQAQADALAAEDAQSVPALRARQALAIYDMDDAGQLAVVDAWRARYPGAAWLAWRRLGLLRSLGRLDEARAEAETLARAAAAEPLHWQRHAEDLLDDGRHQGAAARWLHKALRRQPREGAILASLARLATSAGREAEALEARRFAACLDPTHEPAQRAYFWAARQARGEERALDLLRDRVRRAGRLSSGPARTLFTALDDLHRTPEAFAVLERALEDRPDDGELLLFAAEAEGRYGRFEAARERLKVARDCSPVQAWHRAAALLAQFQGHSQEAVAHWRRVVAGDPADLDAQRELCQVLQLTEGRTAVRAHLAAQLERCPRHHGLLRLQVEWARAQDHESAAAALDRMLALYPGDAWTRRERALLAVERQSLDVALDEARQALALEPWAPASPGVLGYVLTEAGRLEEARPLLRRALELAADYGSAAHNLLAASPGEAEGRAELDFLLAQIERQGQAGDGLFTYRTLARGRVPPAETLAELKRFAEARTDLWQPFSALALEAIDQGRFAEAEDVLNEALRRFPLILALRLDLALLARRRGDPELEQAALTEAVRQEPSASNAVRRLGDLLAAQGGAAEALTLLEQLAARHPAEAENHAFLADVLWQEGQRERAVAHLVRAVQERPGYEWAWRRLRERSTALGQQDLSRDTARSLVADRPAQAQAWLALARELDRPEDQAERFAALDRAQALAPRWVELHDERAAWLSAAGRHDEALAACEPRGWAGALPCELRGRALWVRYQRGETRAAIDGLLALLEQETGYTWGARCLAEWQRECGTAAEYHAAAERLVRLAPDDASAHGHRGEALEGLGRVEEALAVYRLAVDLDPVYPFGRDRLLSLLVEQERTEEAAQLLERLADHLPGPELLAWRVQLLLRREPASAAAQVEDLLRHPETSPAVVRRAARACLAAKGGLELLRSRVAALGTNIHPEAAAGLATTLIDGAPEALEAVLSTWGRASGPRCSALVACLEANPSHSRAMAWARELTEAWPDEPRHWLLLEAALGQANAPSEERLAALERASALDPGLVEALDRRAVLLARLSRYDEAAALCRQLVDGRRPLPLRGREAWLIREQGQAQAAVAALRAVLDDDPLYAWGWRCLTDWVRESSGPPRDYLEVARGRCAVAPGDPDAWTHLAQALERDCQPEPAAEAYARALELDPQATWAAESLFDLRLKQDRLEQAAAALAGAPESDTLSLRRLQLHLRRGETDAADALLARLCGDPATRRDVLQYVVGLYADEGLELRSAGVLAKALDAPDVHPFVARLHVGRLVTHGSVLAALRTSERLLRDPRLAAEGGAGFLEAAANHGQHLRVRYFVWRHRDELRRDTRLWGAAGVALMKRSCRRALAWMADWRQRTDARGWMLANVAVLLRQAGEDAQGAEASREALRREQDHSWGQHRIWLALDAALAERFDEARRLLSGLDETELSEYYRFFAGLAQTLLELGRRDEEGRLAAERRLSDATARDPRWRSDPLERRLGRQVLKRLWQRQGLMGRLRAALPW